MVGENDFLWWYQAYGYFAPVYFGRKFLIREYGICINSTSYAWTGSPMQMSWPKLEIGIYRAKVNTDFGTTTKKLHSKKWDRVDNKGFYSHKFDPPLMIPAGTLLYGAVLQISVTHVKGQGNFASYATRYGALIGQLYEDDVMNLGADYGYPTKGYSTISYITELPDTGGSYYREDMIPSLFFRERNQRELQKLPEDFEYDGWAHVGVNNDDSSYLFEP